MLPVNPGAGLLVLAYDPGLTTGAAVLDVEADHHMASEVEGRFNFYDTFRTLVSLGRPLEVVGELYAVNADTHKKSRQYDPFYVNGHLEAECRRLGIPFTLQTPGEAKKFSTNEKLKAVGWYTATTGGHANDANRHLLKYVIERPHLGAKELKMKLVTALGIA